MTTNTGGFTVTMNNRLDNGRRVRWNVSFAVLVFDLVVAIGPGYVVYAKLSGHGDEITGGTLAWVGASIAVPLLVISFVLAVRLLRNASRPGAWRLTAWAGGLFLAGVLALVGSSAIASHTGG